MYVILNINVVFIFNSCNVISIINLGIGYIFEALQFHLLKYIQPFTVSQTIQSTPRQSISFQKV